MSLGPKVHSRPRKAKSQVPFPQNCGRIGGENPAAAYLQLDTWAVDQETLSLDLARDEFTKSGKLFVWFFRGGQVVWEEHIRWPGYK